MKHIPVGARRTKCDICPGKSRYGRWVKWRGATMYLCVKCIQAAEKIIQEENDDATAKRSTLEYLDVAGNRRVYQPARG